jgi:uncharacterized protein YbjQ (UPF0145 family)
MDNFQKFELFMNFGVPFIILILAYFVGTILERRHFDDIRRREADVKNFPVLTFETLPEAWQVGSVGLTTGSVVVSLDYFKRVIAGLRALVGGRIKTYEPLLDRARREAMLRMVERAKRDGYDAVVNARLETSRLANSRGNGKGTAGVEMLAFGTAITLNKRW